MNRISKSILKIAKQLADDGLNERAAQFIILADKLQDEINMKKIAKTNLLLMKSRKR